MRPGAIYAVILVFALAVLSPVVRPGAPDSYPLSTYPMFSHDRGRLAGLDTVVGREADGAVRRLTPTLIAGGHEVIHAAATVSRSIVRGDTPAFCAEVAARVARDRGRATVTSVEVVTETLDVVAWWHGDRAPLGRTVHASCTVTRGG